MTSDIDILHAELLKKRNKKPTPKCKKVNDDEDGGNHCYLDYNADVEFERTVRITTRGVIGGEFC